MKCIIVGLGSFGASLGEKLTAEGHEIIGIDINMNRVDHYKERISHTICMDATDEFTVSGLPLKDTDLVIVAIGENQGANVMSTALFKNFKVKKLISRSISPIHEKVLMAIGVDRIVHPEEESAERWAKKLIFKGVVDSFELSSEYSVVEVDLPKSYENKTIREIKIREEYHLLILTTIKQIDVKPLIGSSRKEDRVRGVANPNDMLNPGDILVVCGSHKDIKNFLQKEK
ncbi:potassium channel family protein [Nonlabens antarcticus]|uniref:potassium channel family protein n=1 Tax=Nonlabens antarcticus TaxID=392714 RepID=UPI001891D9B5|nr:TrkA family potassium uptake protein [Nonlabens antarcticus]